MPKRNDMLSLEHLKQSTTTSTATVTQTWRTGAWPGWSPGAQTSAKANGNYELQISYLWEVYESRENSSDQWSWTV